MNGPAWMPWLVGVLVLALAVVSALAGVMWTRARALPLWQVAQLARELAERQRALEEFLAKLERGTRGSKPGFRGATPTPHPPASPATSPSRGEVVHESPGRALPARPPAPQTISPTGEVANRRRDAAHVAPPGPTLIAVPDLATATSREVVPPSSEEFQRRHGAVWELADAGARAEQIASHLGLPIGHVELILGLRKPLATGAGGR